MYQFFGEEIFLSMKVFFLHAIKSLSLFFSFFQFFYEVLSRYLAPFLSSLIASVHVSQDTPKIIAAPAIFLGRCISFSQRCTPPLFPRAFTKRLVHIAAFSIFETSSFQLLENLRMGRELQRCVIKPSRNFYEVNSSFRY